MIKILEGDNLNFLNKMEDQSIQLIYIDPPYNTKKIQRLGNYSYEDSFDNFIEFLKPRLIESKRILKNNGSIFIHLDYREVHYIKILMDQIFGRECFMNEIIWAYDYGARTKRKWPTKHDNILWYVKDPNNYIFNYDQIDRIPYLSPKLVGEEKAKRGKTPTDVWWNTIVHTTGKERTGYPTQKPLKILERIVKVHSNENDLLLDYFAGSGSFGEAAIKNNRSIILIDKNPQAISIMKQRLLKNRLESI